MASVVSTVITTVATTAVTTAPGVTQSSFGKTSAGEEVSLFTLTNAAGMEVKVTNFGGIITAIKTVDARGEFADIALGFDELEPYLQDSPYFGALIGRFGNRIAKGRFTLDGKVYQLDINNGVNHLHGGITGFDKVVWSATPFTNETAVGLVLFYVSRDGDQGYPGNLQVRVTYTLTNDNELLVDYHATTDQLTPVNLTQHTYFNLAGAGDILQHRLMINADAFTPIDETQIPSGGSRSVVDTPFDFRVAKAIGEAINQDDEQIKNGLGYDHNFVLNKTHSGELSLAARVVEETSGRVLEVYTQEPGVQFYSGNFLDGSLTGKGNTYTHRSGFCLETQHFPDSPNQPDFPSTLLHPGDEYTSRTIFKFFTLDTLSE
jgi:aldose 1-epimerase